MKFMHAAKKTSETAPIRYLQSFSILKDIKEIQNSPMEDNFIPDEDKGELDLTEQFKDETTSRVSIRNSLQNIANGVIFPEGATRQQPIFYLKSTAQKRYFKI